MDQLREFLEAIRDAAPPKGGRLLGLLHVLIGRRISKTDGTALSGGLNWRQVASLMKLVRWEPSAILELGLDPTQFPSRDRQRFWYSVIGQANVASAEARAAGDRLAASVRSLGYVIGPAPSA